MLIPARLFPDPLPLIIPFGGISLLAGAPGVGKTALTATLLTHFRDALPIFGHQPSPLPAGGIGIIAADRSWSSSHEWFVRAGWPDIPCYSLADDPTLDKKRLRFRHKRIDLLDEFLEKLSLPAGGFAIIDPIALFLGGNLLDYDTCMLGCLELRDVLRRRQLSCLGLAHAGKQRSDPNDRYARLQDRILGSTAIFGFSDTQMYLASPEETGESTYTFLMAPHLAPTEVHSLVRDAQGLFKTHEPAPAVDLAEAILACFSDNDSEHLSFAVLSERAKTIPTSPTTLRRYLEKLVEDRRIVRYRHGEYGRARVQ